MQSLKVPHTVVGKSHMLLLLAFKAWHWKSVSILAQNTVREYLAFRVSTSVLMTADYIARYRSHCYVTSASLLSARYYVNLIHNNLYPAA